MEHYEGSYVYCPDCRTEYVPGLRQFCADCGAELVHELPGEPEPAAAAPTPNLGPHPVAVLATFNGLEAEMVRGVLEGAGIPAMVWRSGLEARYGGAAAGPIRVMVPSEDAELAREIVAAPPEAPEEAGE
ncbi:MAG TPA: DUF2007 domain-containing protein [Actinomycetota bacterium]|nr:DUF2007 domain-containing protein [Actinomycetota bacterium]